MLSKAVCMVAGVLVAHFYSDGFFPVSQAAWGWTMDVPSSADFTCEEGTTIGCPDPTQGTNKYGENITDTTKCEAGEATPCCLDSVFTCTVKPKTGKSCDVTSTMIQCAKSATPTDKAQPDQMMCINLGGGNYTKDSNLTWSTVPTCTDTTAANPEPEPEPEPSPSPAPNSTASPGSASTTAAASTADTSADSAYSSQVLTSFILVGIVSAAF